MNLQRLKTMSKEQLIKLIVTKTSYKVIAYAKYHLRNIK